jgi:hypothetical protein
VGNLQQQGRFANPRIALSTDIENCTTSDTEK